MHTYDFELKKNNKYLGLIKYGEIPINIRRIREKTY